MRLQAKLLFSVILGTLVATVLSLGPLLVSPYLGRSLSEFDGFRFQEPATLTGSSGQNSDSTVSDSGGFRIANASQLLVIVFVSVLLSVLTYANLRRMANRGLLLPVSWTRT